VAGIEQAGPGEVTFSGKPAVRAEFEDDAGFGRLCGGRRGGGARTGRGGAGKIADEQSVFELLRRLLSCFMKRRSMRRGFMRPAMIAEGRRVSAQGRMLAHIALWMKMR